MMSIAQIAVAVTLVLAAFAASADAMPSLHALTLTAEDIVRIRPAAATTLESFSRDWGQFEVLIPKQRFPIPAPNCRKDVILRMPAVAPDAPDRERQIELRWMMFQSLHELINNRGGTVAARLAPGPYMRTGPDGEPILEYCNAYFGREFASP